MTDRKPLPVISAGAIGAAPVFEKIGIVGLGLIGGSIAMASRAAWPNALIIGVDTGELLEAMVLHAVDVGADDVVVLSEADLVILAAPVRQNLEMLDEVAAHVGGEAVVTDVGSTKRAIVEAARGLPPRLRFVGGHPLAGAPRQGIRHARADLFTGRPWLLTPDGDAHGEALLRLRAFIEAVGAVPRTMDAREHDRVLASLGHLPQLAATALMHILGTRLGRDGLSLAGRGVVDTTRLASSDAAAWRDVCATNADEIRPALDALIEALETLRDDLGTGSRLDELFESANDWRETLTSAVDGAAAKRET